MKRADLELRQILLETGELNDGYNPEMEALHLKNTSELERIIDDIGYPTIAKIGKEASDAAWLVIQHSISNPGFMRRCLRLMEKEKEQGLIDPINVAYLSDRIAVFQGLPQLYGTQYDWDLHGLLSPNPYDDIKLVNQRRASIGLTSLEENTIQIRARTEQEGGKPPSDLKTRTKAYNSWREKVGWI